MSEEAAAVTGPPANLFSGIVKAIRPRQWVKNLLVLAAPVAALGGSVTYDYRDVALKVAIAFIVFSLAASSIYLVNDCADVERDRQAESAIGRQGLREGLDHGVARDDQTGECQHRHRHQQPAGDREDGAAPIGARLLVLRIDAGWYRPVEARGPGLRLVRRIRVLETSVVIVVRLRLVVGVRGVIRGIGGGVVVVAQRLGRTDFVHRSRHRRRRALDGRRPRGRGIVRPRARVRLRRVDVPAVTARGTSNGATAGLDRRGPDFVAGGAGWTGEDHAGPVSWTDRARSFAARSRL